MLCVFQQMKKEVLKVATTKKQLHTKFTTIDN